MILRPQPGKQEDFCSSIADIVIFGGQAGGGKSFGILLEGTRHINNRNFGAVIFRRVSTQITSEGGLWDEAKDMYTPLGAKFVENPKHIVKFPSGSKITFSHMQHEKNMSEWDGSQIPLIVFDELQHFTEKQFWYMLSRNRSTCGVKPYIRATCNPNPDSFLLNLLDYWIDEAGDPIEERSGNIRYFIRKSGVVHWADSEEELKDEFGNDCLPKSFTFISSSLDDNPALLESNPEYKANIEAMLDYEKKRLQGNWHSRPTAGELFKRHYFEIIDIDDIDMGLVTDKIRYWDRAATLPNELNQDPDYTAGVLAYKYYDESYIIVDIAHDRLEPADVESLIENMADMDGKDVIVGLEQEPGASGKSEVSTYERLLVKYDVRAFNKTKNKLTCWKPSARLSKKGKIKLVKGEWNKAFLQEAESVTDGTQPGHDDQIDAMAGAISHLLDSSFGIASFKEGA